MVHATARANPRLGGGITSFDADDARKARGVIKVVPVPRGFGVIADNTWRGHRRRRPEPAHCHPEPP
jgi:isoquinoline 1-oxidoreductase beta subunit